MNDIHPELREATEDRIASLERSVFNDTIELTLLKDVLADKYPEAVLTHVAMDDEPLVLFPGDIVFTKYGKQATISHFGKAEDDEMVIHFTDHIPLELHRISSVVKRARPELQQRGDYEQGDTTHEPV